MKTVFLHIGYSKSGSTGIQSFLSANRSNLKEREYIYPEIDDRDDHYKIYSMINSGKVNEASELIVKFLKYSDNLILSSEFFPKYYNEFAFLNEIADTVKIVAYVRRQDLWVESAYQQIVKCQDDNASGRSLRGTTQSSAEYVDSISNKIDWYSNLKQWENNFGHSNIIVRPFEKQQFFSNSLYGDFLHIIGLSLNDSYIFPEESGSNVSLNFIATEMIRLHNKILQEDSDPCGWILMREISEFVKLNKNSRLSILSVTERDKILNKFAGGNSEIAKRYLNRDDGRLFYQQVENDYQEPMFSLEEVVPLLMQIMFKQSQKIANLKKRITALENKS